MGSIVGGLIMLSLAAFAGDDMVSCGRSLWMFGEGLGCKGERVVDGEFIPAARLRSNSFELA